MPSSENLANDPTLLPDSVTSDRQTPKHVDAIVECLASHRRRLPIESLSETSGPVVVEADHKTKTVQEGDRFCTTASLLEVI